MELAHKRILLGVTGGIAAYKAAELCRLFVKAGAERAGGDDRKRMPLRHPRDDASSVGQTCLHRHVGRRVLPTTWGTSSSRATASSS